MQLFEGHDRLRKDLKIVSEKTRYKILLTLFASEKALSFSQLQQILPKTKENQLDYHLKYLRKHGLVKNETKSTYKRDEYRSFYSLSNRALDLLQKLGLSEVKPKFQALFKKLMD